MKKAKNTQDIESGDDDGETETFLSHHKKEHPRAKFDYRTRQKTFWILSLGLLSGIVLFVVVWLQGE